MISMSALVAICHCRPAATDEDVVEEKCGPHRGVCAALVTCECFSCLFQLSEPAQFFVVFETATNKRTSQVGGGPQYELLT